MGGSAGRSRRPDCEGGLEEELEEEKVGVVACFLGQEVVVLVVGAGDVLALVWHLRTTVNISSHIQRTEVT